MSYGGASGGAGKISTSSDVVLSNPLDQQVLSYNASLQKWQNFTVVSGISYAIEKDILSNGAKTVVANTNSAITKFTGTLSASRTVTLGAATTGATIELSFIDSVFNGYAYTITNGAFSHVFNYPTYVKYVFIGGAWERIV